MWSSGLLGICLFPAAFHVIASCFCFCVDYSYVKFASAGTDYVWFCFCKILSRRNTIFAVCCVGFRFLRLGLPLGLVVGGSSKNAFVIS